MLGRRRGHEPSVGRDELDREQAVDRQAVLPREPADPAAEREPGDARVRDLAARDGEPVRLRLAVDVAPERARLGAGDPRARVDPDGAHPREVEDDAAVDGRVAGGGVPAAADGELDARLAGVVHDRDDVDRALDPRDRRGAAVEHPVPDAPRLVVAGVAGRDQLAAKLLRERRECRGRARSWSSCRSFRVNSL